jgi:cytochrome c553
MSTVDERPSIAERYATATSSGDLTPRTAGVTDADVLLAAGIAASKDPRRLLALKLYRMGARADMEGLWEVVAQCDAWMAGYLSRGGRRQISKSARGQLITDTLQWWLQPTCGYCSGRGFVTATVQGTDEEGGRLTTMQCGSCHGSTKRPLAREVPPQLHQHAAWLTGELDRLVALVHDEMAKLLGQRLGS